MTHVVPPFVVRAMPPLDPTTRHTFTGAHAAPSTPPTFGRVSLDQCAPSSVVKSASACSGGRGAFTLTFGHPGGVISPATTHLLGVGQAMTVGCNLLGVAINNCQWFPPSELPMIEPGPLDSYSPTAKQFAALGQTTSLNVSMPLGTSLAAHIGCPAVSAAEDAPAAGGALRRDEQQCRARHGDQCK